MNLVNLFFLSPLLFVTLVAVSFGWFWRNTTLGIRRWIALACAMPLAAMLPLAAGVWLPDLRGQLSTLDSASARSGHRIEVVQYWNQIDFYTTEIRVVAPDGTSAVTTLDADAGKTWTANIEMHPSQNRALITVPGYGPLSIRW